jgi:hypothetical protein
MYLSPASEQKLTLLGDDRHCPPNIAALHLVDPDEFGCPARASEIDLGLSVAENMDVRRLVIVWENDHAHPMRPVRSAWICR